MKYAQWIGLAGVVLVIAGCYLPWIEIPSLPDIITGMEGQGTNFGRPGKLHIIFCIPALILFIIPRVWAKRVNWLFCALGLAWAVRNFLIYAHCEMGTCPERKYGLYFVLAGSVIMLAAALFPDMKVAGKEAPRTK